MNGTVFGRVHFEYKSFDFFIQLLSKIFVIVRRIQRDITNSHRSSYKVPVIIARVQ